MKKYIDSLLEFSRKERWGIYVLSVVCILAWCIPYFLSTPILQTEELEMQIIDLEMKRNKIILLHKPIKESSYKKYWQLKHPASMGKTPSTVFDFDPNHIGKEGWMKLGMEERMASGIVKYIQKGGRFRKKEDLKKIYGMTDELYHTLEPHILLDEEVSSSNVFTAKTRMKKIIDLNKADSADLVSLPGIGEKLSSRIIRFRDKLGGFTSIAQLSEVYGIDPSLVSALADNFVVHQGADVKHIRINEIRLEELAKHPYAGYVNAKLIVAYRTAHGQINNADELLSIGEIDKTKIEKLLAYLLF